MKRCIALGLVLLLAAPAFAQDDTAKFLGGLATKYSGSLATLKYTIALETGDRPRAGQAVCISNEDKLGVFVTTALDAGLNVDLLKDFQIVTPGADGKTLKARLLGVEPLTGFGFVQATEKHDWQVVQFARSSGLQLGQQVGSVGLMMGDPARPVYLGTGYVSAMLRVPGPLAYVAGGGLTGSCSPVFTTDGRAVGLVSNQPFVGYDMPSQQGMVSMQLRSQLETIFFTPVEEFIHVLDNKPTDGKVARLPWLGVNKFEAVTPALADLLRLDQPAVKLDQVFPKQPAAEAGLSNNDIIIEMNGKPLDKLATPELSVLNFVRKMMRMRAGETITLKVISGRDSKEVKVTLGEMPTQPGEAKRYFNRDLGLLVREKVMLDEYLSQSPAAKVPGLIVMGFVKGSASATAGFEAGDVITNVNNQPVKAADVFEQIVEQSLRASRTAPINFLVRREDQMQVITVKPGV